jgi:lipid-binding SYLF domain-containing protein
MLLRGDSGTFGAQIGGESADVAMLVMNRSRMEQLASDNFTLGADLSVAGPVGMGTKCKGKGPATTIPESDDTACSAIDPAEMFFLS